MGIVMSIFANLQFVPLPRTPRQREEEKTLSYPLYQVLPSPHVYPGDFLRLMNFVRVRSAQRAAEKQEKVVKEKFKSTKNRAHKKGKAFTVVAK